MGELGGVDYARFRRISRAIRTTAVSNMSPGYQRAAALEPTICRHKRRTVGAMKPEYTF